MLFEIQHVASKSCPSTCNGPLDWGHATMCIVLYLF
jgi:hypothetical protein